MIYLFYGSDEAKARAKAFEWVAKARAKEPNLAYARLMREELTAAALESATASGGLFIKRLLVLLDDPFPKPRAADAEEDASEELSGAPIDEWLEALAESDNAIVVLAPRLPAPKAKKWEAKAKQAYRYDAPAMRAARGFNSGLANALAARRADALWLEVVRAERHGDAPEMLHGLLHWKARDLMEKGGRAWPKNEARTLSRALIELLMESRRTGADLSRSLERFALSLR
jgi:hypothetical protein